MGLPRKLGALVKGEIPTILLVQFLHFERELSFQDDFVVELMPSTDCRPFWTWKFCEGMEVQSVDNNTKQIHSVCRSKGDDRMREKLCYSHDKQSIRSCWFTRITTIREAEWYGSRVTPVMEDVLAMPHMFGHLSR